MGRLVDGARLMARAQSVEPGVHNARLKLLVLAALCLLPLFGGLQMGLSGQSWLALALYPLASLVSVMLYWQDKQQARRQGWRTPEKVLHASELLGGGRGLCWPSSCFGTRPASCHISWCSGRLCWCTRCSGLTGCFCI